jgi:hypothetical protein
MTPINRTAPENLRCSPRLSSRFVHAYIAVRACGVLCGVEGRGDVVIRVSGRHARIGVRRAFNQRAIQQGIRATRSRPAIHFVSGDIRGRAGGPGDTDHMLGFELDHRATPIRRRVQAESCRAAIRRGQPEPAVAVPVYSAGMPKPANAKSVGDVVGVTLPRFQYQRAAENFHATPLYSQAAFADANDRWVSNRNGVAVGVPQRVVDLHRLIRRRHPHEHDDRVSGCVRSRKCRRDGRSSVRLAVLCLDLRNLRDCRLREARAHER